MRILFIQYTFSLYFHSIVNLSNTGDSQPTQPPIILSVLLVKYFLCKCYVYTCVHVCVCVYICVDKRLYAYMSACVCLSLCVFVLTCKCMCVRVFLCVRACVCMCVCVRRVRARVLWCIFLIIIAVDLEVKPQISLSIEDGDVLSPVLEMVKSNRTSM